MSGRTPARAVDAFLAPIQSAFGAFTSGHLGVERNGAPNRPGVEYAWRLNNGRGAEFPTGHTLFATMWWRILADEREDYGPFRVTTTGYTYALRDGDDAAVWDIHWHPQGKSHVKTPHAHLGALLLADDGPLRPGRHHLSTPRMTFEDALRWCVECGVEPASPAWESTLLLAEAPHKLFRSWA